MRLKLSGSVLWMCALLLTIVLAIVPVVREVWLTITWMPLIKFMNFTNLQPSEEVAIWWIFALGLIWLAGTTFWLHFLLGRLLRPRPLTTR